MATSATVKKPATDKVSDIASARPPMVAKSKKWLLISIAVILLVAGGGAGTWRWMSQTHAPVSKAVLPPPNPVFVELDSFTVNLAADRILQTSLTVQVKSTEDAAQIKLYMPQVKSRLLLLMSAKDADALNTGKGKEALAAEIVTLLRQPFAKGLAPLGLTGVFFTSFVIQ